MDKLLFKYRRILIISASVIFWIAFIYIWGLKGWNDAQLFTKWWWFDFLGHVIAGIILSINIFFILRNYTSPRKSFRLLSNGYQGFFVVTIMITVSTFWEFFEGILDVVNILFQIGRFPAQTHALDTTIDIFTTSAVSIPAVYFYIQTISYFQKKFPNEKLQEEIIRYEEYGKSIASQMRVHDKNVQKTILKKITDELKKI